MIYIDLQADKYIRAKAEFLAGMKLFVQKRAGTAALTYPKAKQDFETLVEPRIDDILVGSPYEIEKINHEILPQINTLPSLRAYVKKVFNYTGFSRKKKDGSYDAYKLATALDIRTCPFCNRNFTSTVVSKSKKILRPAFDHYFPKEDYPLLAISFQNLIPSCTNCNSNIKGRQNFKLEEHLHPYVDDGFGILRFSYAYNKDGSKTVKVVAESSEPGKAKKAQQFVKDFSLEAVYGSHVGELNDLLQLKQCFSDRYLDILQNNLLSGANISKKEMYRIFFVT